MNVINGSLMTDLTNAFGFGQNGSPRLLPASTITSGRTTLPIGMSVLPDKFGLPQCTTVMTAKIAVLTLKVRQWPAECLTAPFALFRALAFGGFAGTASSILIITRPATKLPRIAPKNTENLAALEALPICLMRSAPASDVITSLRAILGTLTSRIVGLIADGALISHHLNYTIKDLSTEYCELAMKRNQQGGLL